MMKHLSNVPDNFSSLKEAPLRKRVKTFGSAFSCAFVFAFALPAFNR